MTLTLLLRNGRKYTALTTKLLKLGVTDLIPGQLAAACSWCGVPLAVETSHYLYPFTVLGLYVYIQGKSMILYVSK